MWWIEQASFGGMTVHAADRYFFFDQRTTAGLLAGGRACQTQDIGEWQHLFDQACRLFHRPLSDQLQIAGDINMCRAIYLAGGLAIRIVVGEQHLQVGTTNVEQFVRIRSDYHSWESRCRTRRQRLLYALDVYQAHTTGGGWLQLFVITHIWNICNAIVDCHTQQ